MRIDLVSNPGHRITRPLLYRLSYHASLKRYGTYESPNVSVSGNDWTGPSIGMNLGRKYSEKISLMF